MSDTNQVTGHDLKDLGFEPKPWFGAALKEINERQLSKSQAARVAQRFHDELAAAEAARRASEIPLHAEPAPFQINMTAETEDEITNLAAVRQTFEILMRTPTLEQGAIMPDACVAGPMGTIPVGGVIAARNAIHPGAHSADICCSMTATLFDNADPKALLDAAHSICHFGPGGRSRHQEVPLPLDLREAIAANPILSNGKIAQAARSHFATSGDGNHFIFIGISEETGKTTMVTHHGSRGPGALLYKAGMKIAEEYRARMSPETLPQNAWIPADSEDGVIYWEALQIMREWTKRSHEALHDAAGAAIGAVLHQRLWNPHNFVFREADGNPNGDLFWHAKGATPIHAPLLHDTTGTQIVPLNMAQPVLFIQSERNERNIGFAPHGAGRNLSRTQHKARKSGRTDAEIFAEETAGLDVRFHSGRIDVSELPSAYKDADSVRADMERFGLARVVDQIHPMGSIMSGDWEADAPWKKKAKAKAEAKARAN